MHGEHTCNQCRLWDAVEMAKSTRMFSNEIKPPVTVASLLSSRRTAKTIGAETSVGPTASVSGSVSSYAPTQGQASSLKNKLTPKDPQNFQAITSAQRASGSSMQDTLPNTTRRNLEDALTNMIGTFQQAPGTNFDVDVTHESTRTQHYGHVITIPDSSNRRI
jgi:hypothetical protein